MIQFPTDGSPVPPWAPEFLSVLATMSLSGRVNVKVAADLAGVSESFAHRFRKRANASWFRLEWDRCILQARVVEESRRRRADAVRRYVEDDF